MRAKNIHQHHLYHPGTADPTVKPAHRTAGHGIANKQASLIANHDPLPGGAWARSIESQGQQYRAQREMATRLAEGELRRADLDHLNIVNQRKINTTSSNSKKHPAPLAVQLKNVTSATLHAVS